MRNSVISYVRKGRHGVVACIHNFTPNFHDDYFVSLRGIKRLNELFNTDCEEFGGSGKLSTSPVIVRDQVGHPIGFSFRLAPLATMIFEVEFVSG